MPDSVEAPGRWLLPNEKKVDVALWSALLGLPLLVLALRVLGSSPELNQWALGLLSLCTYALLMRRLRVGWCVIVLQLAALVCYVVYTSYTSVLERTPDALAQLRYFEYVRKHLARPPPTECLVCNHPPLYYALLVAWSTLNGVIEVLPGARVFQTLSLALAAMYLAFATLTLRQFTPNRALVCLGTALVGFWPSSVMQSCRVHNDSLAKVLVLAGLYWLIRWYQEDSAKNLALSASFATLSIYTKSSGYPLVLALGMLVIFRAMTASYRRRISELQRLWPVLIVVFGVAAVQVASPAPVGATRCERLFGQACKPRGPATPNDFVNYVRFDLKEFVASPYLVVGKNEFEYRYFLNCFLKSGLFGMHTARADAEMAQGHNPQIARVLNCVLLMMVGYVLVLFVARPRISARRHAPDLAFLAISLALLVIFRAVAPISYHSDFRHVQPLLVVFVVLWIDAIEWHLPKRKALAAIGILLSGVMIGGSVLHWMPNSSLDVATPVQGRAPR